MEGVKGRRLGEEILNISYKSNIDSICVPTQPKLNNWMITAFENTQLKIYLNMSNPVYVSSSDIPDEITLQVNNKYMFQSLETNVTIKEGFKLSHGLPSMIESSDRLKLFNLGKLSQNSLLLTLVIPFCFLIFVQVSMDSVWTMYLTLQILCNLLNIMIKRPGNAELILFVGSNISNFKINEDPTIKQWIKMGVSDWVANQSSFLIYAIFGVVLMVVIAGLKMLLKNKTILEKI